MIITLKGTVSSGRGEGTWFTNLQWVKEQLRRELNIDLYPGTLNLNISSACNEVKLLNRFGGIEIRPEKGFYGGRCFRALIMGETHGAVIKPEILHYPTDLIEVIAPIHLREKFRLKDGDEVEVTIWLE